eukprot:6214560-Pleurochrysis_carterae.AAC.6
MSSRMVRPSSFSTSARCALSCTRPSGSAARRMPAMLQYFCDRANKQTGEHCHRAQPSSAPTGQDAVRASYWLLCEWRSSAARVHDLLGAVLLLLTEQRARQGVHIDAVLLAHRRETLDDAGAIGACGHNTEPTLIVRAQMPSLRSPQSRKDTQPQMHLRHETGWPLGRKALVSPVTWSCAVKRTGALSAETSLSLYGSQCCTPTCAPGCGKQGEALEPGALNTRYVAQFCGKRPNCAEQELRGLV